MVPSDDYRQLMADIDEARHRHGRRNGDDDRMIMRKLQMLVIYVALATMLITIGYNWRRVDEIIEVQARSDHDHELFMRKDVATEQYSNLVHQIQEVKQLVELAGTHKGADDGVEGRTRQDRRSPR